MRRKFAKLSVMFCVTSMIQVVCLKDCLSFAGDAAKYKYNQIDLKHYGARADNGFTDNGKIIQKIIDVSPSGTIINLPPAEGKYVIKTPVRCIGKDITFVIEGTIKDEIPKYVSDYSNIGINGKGVFAFENCRVKIVGKGATIFEGSIGNPEVSQIPRAAFYFFRCSSVYLQSLKIVNPIGSAVVTYNCNNITDVNSYYKGGSYTVLHSGGKNIIVSGCAFENNIYGALTIHNRGGYKVEVLSHTRPQNIKVINNVIKGTYTPSGQNIGAVGITVDSCDDINVSGNTVDGMKEDGSVSIAMGYSFAGSIKGIVANNTARNISSKTSGTYRYAGIGMECDSIRSIKCVDNTFYDCLIGYLIVSASNCSFNGKYIKTTNNNNIVNTLAGISAYVDLMGPNNPSKNIVISGSSNGGTVSVYIRAAINNLSIRDFNAKDYTWRGFFIDKGANVSNFTITNTNVSLSEEAKNVIVAADNTLNDILVNNLNCQAKYAPEKGTFIFRGDKPGGRYVFDSISADNWDQGIGTTYGFAESLVVRGFQFNGKKAMANNIVYPKKAIKNTIADIYKNSERINDLSYP